MHYCRARGADAVDDEEEPCRRATRSDKLKGPPVLKLQPGKKDFNLRAIRAGHMNKFARAFESRRLLIGPGFAQRATKMDAVDFETAMRVLGQQTTTFYRPLTGNMIFVAADTIEKRKQYGLEVEQHLR